MVFNAQSTVMVISGLNTCNISICSPFTVAMSVLYRNINREIIRPIISLLMFLYHTDSRDGYIWAEHMYHFSMLSIHSCNVSALQIYIDNWSLTPS